MTPKPALIMNHWSWSEHLLISFALQTEKNYNTGLIYTCPTDDVKKLYATWTRLEKKILKMDFEEAKRMFPIGEQSAFNSLPGVHVAFFLFWKWQWYSPGGEYASCIICIFGINEILWRLVFLHLFAYFAFPVSSRHLCRQFSPFSNNWKLHFRPISHYQWLCNGIQVNATGWTNYICSWRGGAGQLSSLDVYTWLSLLCTHKQFGHGWGDGEG